MRIIASLCLFSFIGCQSQPLPPSWLEAITLYASFDEHMDADYAEGDPLFYMAPSWDALSNIERVKADNPYVTRIPTGGKYGGALSFDSNWNPVLFFKGAENVAYRDADWSGSFSFWLRVNPDEDLREGYSDPLIVTDENWDNGSFYVDFTEEDRPRHFRFALFSDYAVWNPELKAWDEIKPVDRPMIDVEHHPFGNGEWAHVALVFENVNVEGASSLLRGYLNGEQVGEYEVYPARITWDVHRTMLALGRHYKGQFDELAVFNRALTPEEVGQIASLDARLWLKSE